MLSELDLGEDVTGVDRMDSKTQPECFDDWPLVKQWKVVLSMMIRISPQKDTAAPSGAKAIGGGIVQSEHLLQQSCPE